MGLLRFAEFEMALDANIGRLMRSIGQGRWFSGVDVGETVVVPKSVEAESADPDDVVRIGQRRRRSDKACVRLQLAPTPEFSVVEVLYLWEFGAALESTLDDCCVGDRLKRTRPDGPIDRNSPDLFAHWPSAFRKYRDDPILEARRLLASPRGRACVTSTDVVSFFDSIDPSFLLEPKFVSHVATSAAAHGSPFHVGRYRAATKALLSAFGRFREQRRRYGVEDTRVGVPIGALTSRVIANVVLAPLDKYVQRRGEVVLYRRYIDDIVIVTQPKRLRQGPTTKDEALAGVFPKYSAERQGGRFTTPLTRGSFRLKSSKTRVHDLFGPAGGEFLESVAQSFALATSERRALFGNIDTLEKEIETIELFDNQVAGADHVPRLRDADRFTLRRFMATAFVRALERCAFLLDRPEGGRFVERKVKRVLAVLDGGSVLENVETVFALLRVAVMLDHSSLQKRLETWLRSNERQFGRVAAFQWRDAELQAGPTKVGLTSYLRRRREEVIASVCSYVGRARKNDLARLLRHANLRHLDRDDDALMFGVVEKLPVRTRKAHSAISRRLRHAALKTRLTKIELYLSQFVLAEDDAWRGTHPVSALLAVRPPTYSDVAARVLARPIYDPDAGNLVAGSVDALRGTRYSQRDGAFAVTSDHTRRFIRLADHDSPEQLRVVVANLPVDMRAFEGAATGSPRLTLARFRALDEALRESGRAVREARKQGIPALLVLPELSIPRRWRRSLVHHAIREGISLIAGLEYRRVGAQVVNEAVGVFPLNHHRAATASWTKRHPARKEQTYLEEKGLTFQTGASEPRQVIQSAHGRLSVLICSELLEAPALADLRGELELLVVPAWNDDTSTFDHVTHAVSSMLMHAFVAVSNNAEASDSRIVAPISKPRHLRESARIVQRGHSRVIWADLPIRSLMSFHTGAPEGKSKIEFRPLPPGWA